MAAKGIISSLAVLCLLALCPIAYATEVTFTMPDALFEHFVNTASNKMGYVGDGTMEDKQKWVADRLFRIATFGWYKDMEQAEIRMEIKR